MQVIKHASPNFNERRLPLSMLVLHYTGMETGEAAIERLADSDAGVSAHYVVEETGRIIQMVAEDKRAWHAGKGVWRGCEDVNSASIGIEIVNGGHDFGLPDFPGVQIAAVIALTQDIMARHGMGRDVVVAHSDVAPGRKRDPGERFPWNGLAERGVALHVEPVPVGGGRFLAPGDTGEPVAALQSMLALYGFDANADGVFGEATRIQVEAFQRRHRPAQVDGIADMSTIETLNRLLRLYPSFS